ncbi:hypothetical protein ymoll0001_27020 [Yersinia mollaretii ATCC 43969]|uniref:Uncharacterized protein n=1 Tax=Yersinia mollaretii (strain ATCC 43969 / DSM 18520 / CIP 103324 / CNY 7263 / WAIP 204) TaxID=349967 RepID=A0ABM9Y6C4_YERMW|nr:hypothetical protein ymoll0001_27020 [Yersinia mollaretii ATCC 43969]
MVDDSSQYYSTIIMKVPIQTTNMIEIPIKKYFTEQLPWSYFASNDPNCCAEFTLLIWCYKVLPVMPHSLGIKWMNNSFNQ